jgi:hypothetical protein
MHFELAAFLRPLSAAACDAHGVANSPAKSATESTLAIFMFFPFGPSCATCLRTRTQLYPDGLATSYSFFQRYFAS